ncbi:MAG: 4Fe-4S binding protein [Candidatus Heimdallarchaeota archaeon]|nr:4Fe-4S binding protein [Candidatus Heimdallarchaeota archaeon]MCK5049179.1 4Fe-4S binding protein [Candidatus Heimdallarchaeota archaeon]
MGHIDSYLDLQKRLEKMPQGAPETETLFKILEILFTEEEAKLVSVLPIKKCTIKSAAKAWKKSEVEAEEVLNGLAEKGLMMDLINKKGERTFTLAPPMAGFFEFSLMRTDGKFDRKILSELYHQYINVEEEFGAMLWALEPAIDRCLVNEIAVPEELQSIVLDYERATHIIESATCITVGTCYCRHKMEHLGKACDMPQDVCLTFNGAAETLSKHGIAKEITKEEAFEILDRVRDLGLVQIGDNIQEGVNWICNCCGCCCEALLGYKNFGYAQNIRTNFYAKVNEEECNGCSICEEKCPVEAISMVDDLSVIDVSRCIGCGVCTRFCATEALVLERHEETMFVPKDSFERVVLEAIQTNKLHNLLADNFSSLSNKIMNRLLKMLFSLPPVKKSLAEKQLKSRYLTSMFNMYKKIKGGEELEGFDPSYYDHPELGRDWKVELKD